MGPLFSGFPRWQGRQTFFCQQLNSTMKGIPDPDEEDLLVFVWLDVVFPKVRSKLFRFLPGEIASAVDAVWRCAASSDVLRNVHVQYANVVVNGPLDIHLRIINLGTSMMTRVIREGALTSQLFWSSTLFVEGFGLQM